MGLYRDQGIVLRTWRLGESDRIVNLLTERHGKVRAVVKGVRKTKSRFGARLEPMVHCSLLFYEGRELDIVTQAEVVEFFRPVREDLGRLSKAASLLEATDQVCQERHANPRLFAMLLGGLRALAAHDSPSLAVVMHDLNKWSSNFAACSAVMAPSSSHSLSSRIVWNDWPWLPICVATFCSRATSATRRRRRSWSGRWRSAATPLPAATSSP